jgi:hypothetical protein
MFIHEEPEEQPPPRRRNGPAPGTKTGPPTGYRRNRNDMPLSAQIDPQWVHVVNAMAGLDIVVQLTDGRVFVGKLERPAVRVEFSTAKGSKTIVWGAFVLRLWGSGVRLCIHASRVTRLGVPGPHTGADMAEVRATQRDGSPAAVLPVRALRREAAID